MYDQPGKAGGIGLCGSSLRPNQCVPTKQTEISSLLGRLNEVAGIIAKEVDELKSALIPVLSSHDYGLTGKEEKDPPSATPLGNEISILIRKLESTTAVIRDMRTGVEL